MTKFNESSSEGIFRPGSVQDQGHIGSQGLKRAGFVVYDHNSYLVLSFFLYPAASALGLSVCFFFFLSFCHKNRSSSLHALTDFHETWSQESLTVRVPWGATQFGVKGHVGVTKVNDIYCVKKLKQGQMEKLNMSFM